MKKYLVVGNWKENKTVAEARDWFSIFWHEPFGIESTEVVICPPFTTLPTLRELAQDTPLKLGAQDVSQYEKGTYTGEVSAAMLMGLADYALIGHSERRRFFGEGNLEVSQKVRQALNCRIVPIVCISDKVDERGIALLEGEYNEQTFLDQINQVFSGLSEDEKSQIIFGYEPPSAISKQTEGGPKGEAASADSVEKMVKKIKEVAPRNRVIYGGSVKSSNVVDFCKMELLDGVLPGSASLDPQEFRKMILAVEQN